MSEMPEMVERKSRPGLAAVMVGNMLFNLRQPQSRFERDEIISCLERVEEAIEHDLAAERAAQQTAENEELQVFDRLGVVGRQTVVGKHAATNYVHLRKMIDILDAAGMTEAADTLVWSAWHRENRAKRDAEYSRIAAALEEPS